MEQSEKTLGLLRELKKGYNRMLVKNIIDFDGTFGNGFLIRKAIDAAAAEDALWCAEQVYKESATTTSGTHHEEINPEYIIQFLTSHITQYCHRRYGKGIEAIRKGKEDEYYKTVLDAIRCVKLTYGIDQRKKPSEET